MALITAAVVWRLENGSSYPFTVSSSSYKLPVLFSIVFLSLRGDTIKTPFRAVPTASLFIDDSFSNGSCTLVWMEGWCRPPLMDHDLPNIQGLIFWLLDLRAFICWSRNWFASSSHVLSGEREDWWQVNDIGLWILMISFVLYCSFQGTVPFSQLVLICLRRF